MSVCVTVCMCVSCLYEAVLALIMSTVHVYVTVHACHGKVPQKLLILS